MGLGKLPARTIRQIVVRDKPVSAQTSRWRRIRNTADAIKVTPVKRRATPWLSSRPYETEGAPLIKPEITKCTRQLGAGLSRLAFDAESDVRLRDCAERLSRGLGHYLARVLKRCALAVVDPEIDHKRRLFRARRPRGVGNIPFQDLDNDMRHCRIGDVLGIGEQAQRMLGVDPVLG